MNLRCVPILVLVNCLIFPNFDVIQVKLNIGIYIGWGSIGGCVVEWSANDISYQLKLHRTE